MRVRERAGEERGVPGLAGAGWCPVSACCPQRGEETPHTFPRGIMQVACRPVRRLLSALDG
jgi:hypothetical protein